MNACGILYFIRYIKSGKLNSYMYHMIPTLLPSFLVEMLIYVTWYIHCVLYWMTVLAVHCGLQLGGGATCTPPGSPTSPQLR